MSLIIDKLQNGCKQLHKIYRVSFAYNSVINDERRLKTLDFY